MCVSVCVCCRVDPVWWEGLGVSIVTWTVNSESEKNYFQDALKLSYMTDNVDRGSSAPEQT